MKRACTIGALYTPRPSMFSRRDASGAFAHTMPPMTALDEQLQRALLKPAPAEDAFCRGDYWVGLVCYSALAGLALAYVLAQVTS